MFCYGCLGYHAVLDSLMLVQGNADTAMSVSGKACSRTHQAAAEEQSKISRSDKFYLGNVMSRRTHVF